MRSVSRQRFLLVVISSLLQILIFPFAGPVRDWRSSVSLIALAPLFAALLGTGKMDRVVSRRQAAALGYLCGVLWYAGSCWWIYQTMYLYGGLPKPVALCILILFSLYLGLYHALFAWLLVQVRLSRLGIAGALVAAPFLWVATELARGRITGFPWDLLGYTQVNHLLAPSIASMTGVMGLSFVLAAANSLAAGVLLTRGRMQVGLATLFVLLFIVEVGGFLVHAPQQQARFRAVSMQENVSVGVSRVERPLSVEEELSAFGVATRAAASQQSGQPVALVVWPEAPSHFQSNDPGFVEAARRLAETLRAPLIVGSLGVDIDRSAERGYRLYDSAAFFAANGESAGRYDKIHLVPWGEYVPFKNFFSFAQKLTEGVGDMDRGAARALFSAGGRHYGVFICYESIFGDEVREFAGNGAEVLVNISDDGWYGDTGAPWQHLAMARMRAIENRRWLVRSTNSGVTTAIDPYGRLVAEAPRHVRAAFSLPFDYVQQTTWYTRHGDWFAWLCAIGSAALVGVSLFSARQLE